MEKKKNKYTVYMTHYYRFENVEADSEEEAKEEIVDTSWDECLMDVVFDVVNLEEEE